jgi:hypothetical protein
MVFRAYQHIDPSTEKKISGNNFIAESDIQAIYVADRFCVGLVITSHSTITEDQPVSLLTDVSDVGVQRNRGSLSGSPDDINQLDKIDASGGLGHQEEKDLRQLETYGEPERQTTPLPPAEPGTEPPATPTDSETPPPPPADELAPSDEAVPAPTPTETPAPGDLSAPPETPAETSDEPPPPPPSDQDLQDLEIPTAPDTLPATEPDDGAVAVPDSSSGTEQAPAQESDELNDLDNLLEQ